MRTWWRCGGRSAGMTLLLAAALPLCGCVSVRSKVDVEPIHITMDINLKIDRELDRFFGPVAAEDSL